MAQATSSSVPTQSQYHHYVPQFTLRNFAHPFRPPNDRKGKSRNRGKRQKKNWYYPGEPMLHTVSLLKDPPELAEVPVKRSFGVTDMYRDLASASNQHFLEEQLSRLESRASEIIRKIRLSFEAGNQEQWITRPERDLLRKFLFIMKYRNSGFYRRFYFENEEDYSSNDKEALREYMRKKGFKKPLDVWFDNIKAMLELKTDKADWPQKLADRMYPTDVSWYLFHTQSMYLAFCAISSAEDEFVLTENACSIFEGPVSASADDPHDQSGSGVWTNYHEFSPVSPKLMMVLRSFLVPNPEEDRDEGTRRWREAMQVQSNIQHDDPSIARESFLADLPIAKARNSYSAPGPNGVRLLPGEDGSWRPSHRFCFRFFAISSEQVNKINTIFLENTYSCSSFAYSSTIGLRKTLEYYLAMPCNKGFKTVKDTPDDPKLICLKKLEHVLKQLGSNTPAVYQALQNKEEIEEGLNKMLIENFPEEPNDFMKLYLRIGGTKETMFKDMEQARRMLKMRIKIDVWTKGLDETYREDVRNKLRELFCQFLPRRVWYYLKQIRNMVLNETLGSRIYDDTIVTGPEDVLVKANHIIRSRDFCRLMYFGVLNDLDMRKNPGFDLASEITLDETGAERLHLIMHLAFGLVGSICDCGIPAVEKKAKAFKAMIRATHIYKRANNPFWDDEQNIEMCTRVIVRKEFAEILGDSLEDSVLDELHHVLFDIIYPTYTGRNSN